MLKSRPGLQEIGNFTKTTGMDIVGLVLIIIGALALIIFMVRQNMKDRKKLVDQLNRNYRKPRADKADVEIDEVKK